MLSGISGTIREVGENHLQIETGPFCFRIFCASTTLQSTFPGQTVRLYTHLHVREDELSLFGFMSDAEVRLFRLLISVGGIGPKMALEILAAGEGAVIDAIVSENVVFLTSIKGIGKRTAERTVLELRGKVNELSDGVSAKHTDQASGYQVGSDVVSTLEGLGWKKQEIVKKLANAPKELTQAEEMVKWFLTHS